MRSLALALAVLTLAAATAWQLRTVRTLSSETTYLQRKLELATEERDRLRRLVEAREKSDLLERTRALRTEIEHQVESLRGLPFRQPVAYAAVSRKEIRTVFTRLLAEDNSEADFANLGRAWTRLGLLPKPIALRETLLDLLSEQVAAFYDHHEHKLYMFDESSLERPYDRVILAHELTHALQDQHFDLLSLPLARHDNDDRVLAALAVIEGDATAVMTEYMTANVSLRTVLDAASSVMSQQMEQLQKTPRYLRERLMFPYLQGRGFCAAVLAEGGQRAVDGCYQRIPSSTAQILHSEQYLREPPEEPLTVTWPDLELEGRAPAADNVAGEAGVLALLTEWTTASTATKAAAGWRGDRFLSYEDDSLVWKTLWATDEDAREFFEAESAALSKRYGRGVATGDQERLEIAAARGVHLIRKPTDHSVVLIDVATLALAKKAEAQFAD